MLKNALRLLIHDRKEFWSLSKVKLLGRWCGLWSRSGFYFQGRMDIDQRSWWHDPGFVSGSGGYFVPNDPTPRKVLPLEPWDTVRRDLIILLLREITVRNIKGHLAELGVYRGYSARVIHHYLPERKFYLFDTFTGFDQRDIKAEQVATGRKAEPVNFSQTGMERALKNIGPENANIQVFPGYFPGSAPETLRDQQFAFVHLDADLYEPMLAGLSYFYEKMTPGGFILAHDFNSWPGSRKAIQEFFRDKPEVPIPMPDKSGSVLILKLPPPGGITGKLFPVRL
jgi:O-methyltransferase